MGRRGYKTCRVAGTNVFLHLMRRVLCILFIRIPSQYVLSMLNVCMDDLAKSIGCKIVCICKSCSVHQQE